MYRFALCLKYLLSRWLTLLATAAVFLGVGTLVVVLAVMSGFIRDARDLCRGGLSDVIVDCDVMGFPHYDEFITIIKHHPNVAQATPLVQLFALVRIEPDASTNYMGVLIRDCVVYGVRPEELADVSRFAQYLNVQGDAPRPSFDVPPPVADLVRFRQERVFPGCIPGYELVNYRPPKRSILPEEPEEVLLLGRGSKLVLMTIPPSGAEAFGSLRRNMRAYSVVDYYRSRVQEFDTKLIFIPFEEAQKLGEFGDPTGEDKANPPRAHQVRIRLRDYRKAPGTIADLEKLWIDFCARHPVLLRSRVTFLTWEQRQRTILSMLEVQRTVTTIVLGLIVIVAGFLIGAVLTMLVKEKTRDIGILKSLGASDAGAASIFVAYAGVVSATGSLLGLAAGKLFLHYIDAVADFVASTFGFDLKTAYALFFERIPRYEDPVYTAVVVLGAIAWALLCSSISAWRAARLQPVEALRYE